MYEVGCYSATMVECEVDCQAVVGTAVMLHFRKAAEVAATSVAGDVDNVAEC